MNYYLYFIVSFAIFAFCAWAICHTCKTKQRTIIICVLLLYAFSCVAFYIYSEQLKASYQEEYDQKFSEIANFTAEKREKNIYENTIYQISFVDAYGNDVQDIYLPIGVVPKLSVLNVTTSHGYSIPYYCIKMHTTTKPNTIATYTITVCNTQGDVLEQYTGVFNVKKEDDCIYYTDSEGNKNMIFLPSDPIVTVTAETE